MTGYNYVVMPIWHQSIGILHIAFHAAFGIKVVLSSPVTWIKVRFCLPRQQIKPRRHVAKNRVSFPLHAY